MGVTNLKKELRTAYRKLTVFQEGEMERLTSAMTRRLAVSAARAMGGSDFYRTLAIGSVSIWEDSLSTDPVSMLGDEDFVTLAF